MRTTVLAVLGILCVAAASAQTQNIQTTRNSYGSSGVFTFGPRLSNYSTDIREAVTPFLDLQGGVRIDSTRVGGIIVVGFPVSTDINLDNQALTGGVKFHTDGIPLGFFVTARAFLGSAKVDFGLGNQNTDTSGYRGEAGLNIRIGESAWSVQPGYEYDHLETKDFGIRMNTNRLFLNFVYRSRG